MEHKTNFDKWHCAFCKQCIIVFVGGEVRFCNLATARIDEINKMPDCPKYDEGMVF